MKDYERHFLCDLRDLGCKQAAIIYSLVASYKLCAVDPFAYLRDVLDRVL